MVKFNYMRIHKKQGKPAYPINIGELNTLGLEGWEAFAVDEVYIFLRTVVEG